MRCDGEGYDCGLLAGHTGAHIPSLAKVKKSRKKPSKPRAPAQLWHARVRGQSDGICLSETHHDDCDGLSEEMHHICYRSQIPDSCHWTVFENGIPLSRACHGLAHLSHGASLSRLRLTAAVNAVNRAIDAENARLGPIATYPRRPHFFPKG